ncbi:putative LRR receptor-like serine/threonine-protein kinase [Prunus yedoensis var. nudiflora]|uniref:Putative LRR receptor-like serine/threonine-protein kinase n=1 Tax=Prunus yedoensis var. nudiflora TaxID=2094558 RepID=A0A314YKK1_PRUYE|nr:putative LRR receptor-like serine/threonine-protein kinase [Prunus yedoensis var. nudiflora]
MSTPLESATLPSASAMLLEMKLIACWVGVTCNNSTKRVVILNLSFQKMVGSLPPSIGNLTHLTEINLMNNNFSGEIPQEMGRLRSLQYLKLSSNSFSGKISN